MAGINNAERKWERIDNIAVTNAVIAYLGSLVSRAMKKVKAESPEKRKASE